MSAESEGDSDKAISTKGVQTSLNIVADIPHYEYKCISSSHTNLVQTKQTQNLSQDPKQREYACSTSGFNNKEGNGASKDGKKRSSIATTNLGGWERSDTSVVSNDRPDDVI